MINKSVSQILLNRLPLALISLPPDVVTLLEWKFGAEDGLFHSVKATRKRFEKFKDVDIRAFEDETMRITDEILVGIYSCPHCRTDLRKCGVIKRTTGLEIVELYISDDGTQARTNHERFESSGTVAYSCISCGEPITNTRPVYDFLKHGINKNVCIEYLHKNYPNLLNNTAKKGLEVPPNGGIFNVTHEMISALDNASTGVIEAAIEEGWQANITNDLS